MENTNSKKIVFSGIQPTGAFTLGNYIGSIKGWGQLQDEYRCIYSIVDMHAITVRQEPSKLRKNTLDALALIIACGVDPDKSIAFIQSHVRSHAEMSWILSCSTQFGELSRMTQFKEKSLKHADDVNTGLFTYPVLMAADILLYMTDLVPVGADQKQHLELARNVAERFNGRYGDLFTVPEPYIQKVGAKIMSLSDPTKKMSKSDENVNGCVFILDDKDTIIRKFKRAVTDNDSRVAYSEDKPGISNLLTILSVLSGDDLNKIEHDFDGKGYGDFKTTVGEMVAEHLRPIREKFNELSADKGYLEKCYKSGAEQAEALASKTVAKAFKKVGFVSSRV